DTGPNKFQNFPVITVASTTGAATTVNGTLDSIAGETYRVELFSNAACSASGFGEGEVYLGSTDVTIAGGGAHFSILLPIGATVGHRLRATASRTTVPLETSEFSQCVAITEPAQAGPTLTVNAAPDTDDGVCSTIHCSLREAINLANSLPGANTIEFAI